MMNEFLAAVALAAMPVQFGMPSSSSDTRIQIVSYVPDQVVSLRVAAGYAAVVEFAADERIENVVVGNSADWQVTANKAGDHLVIKSLPNAAITNMVVITDTRRYVFLLEASTDGAMTFVLRFTYPGLQPIVVAPSMERAAYKLRGDRKLYPIAMSDDGQRTSITWDLKTSLPAVFAINSLGKEALVNGRMVNGDYVIEGVAERYVLRSGKQRATARRLKTGANK
jgi:type IV secretion system protein VirB9